MIKIGFVYLCRTVQWLHYWWNAFNYPIIVVASFPILVWV